MKKILIILVTSFVAALSGCGKIYVPINGQVLYDGKPASDIVVLFESKGSTKTVTEAGMGKTDTNGRFALKSVDSKKSGVQPGEYTAYFGWKDPSNPKMGDTPEENANLKLAECPYVFPKTINAGEYIFTVSKSGPKHVVFKITKDSVTW